MSSSLRRLAATLACVATPALTASAQAAPRAAAPVDVMIVGVFHMANPGHDVHNIQVDDVLAPKRQGEIAAVTDALARFRPTCVAVEWPNAVTATRWAAYTAGTLAPSRNEVVQLGFRLAKTAKADAVDGVDAEGDFPFGPMKAYADAHGLGAFVDSVGASVARGDAEVERLLAERGVGPALRRLNEPARLQNGNTIYRAMLRVGADTVQPGAELAAAWYRRNARICALMIQHARPGDRVVVFYGAGHAFLLRQCVSETPGFRLVDASDYLPR